MATIFDDIVTADEFHYFTGTRGSDEMHGNGSLHFLIGGGGALDVLNPGIGDRTTEWDPRGFWTVLSKSGAIGNKVRWGRVNGTDASPLPSRLCRRRTRYAMPKRRFTSIYRAGLPMSGPALCARAP